MTTNSAAFERAVQHHQAGRLQAAEEIYRQILAVEPDQPDALHLLGVVAHQAGRYEAAIECIGRAIRLRDNEATWHYNLGNAYRAGQKNADAIACFVRAVDLKPDFAAAHNGLGVAWKNQGQLTEAVACYRRALQFKPDFAEAHYNLGNALKQHGQLDEAIACYRRAVQWKPDYADAHTNLGHALRDQGKLDAALASYQRALQLRPDHIGCHLNLGNAWKDRQQLAQAIACYQRALELQPGAAEVHVNLGNALSDQWQLDEAIACYLRALALQPNLARAHHNLGLALKAQGKLAEAILSFQRALQLQPDFAEAHSDMLYTLYFSPDYDAAAVFEEHRRWNLLHAEPLAKFIQPHGNDRCPSRRLRVGYVSPNFRSHAASFFTVPLLAASDHQHFEIFCYSEVALPDSITERLRSCADVWRNIVGLSDEQLDQLIRQDRIDILVDLTLHMGPRNRVLVFARKPAPVQVCWLAYQGTTGLRTMDYRLTDAHIDPPALDERCYSEESIRLPSSFWCYDPLTSDPPVGPPPVLAKGHITFGSLNNFCKVNAVVLRLWARVLNAVEHSRLLLLAAPGSQRRSTLDLLEEEGIQADRIAFVANQPRHKYLELYHDIDIGLDTAPYNGQTTTLDAFWMGVPVVTLRGQTAVARAGASLLSKMQMPALIADTPEQFVTIAAQLAGDLPRLIELRASLRERLQKSPLMDAPRFARDVEAAYRSMWQRWCEK